MKASTYFWSYLAHFCLEWEIFRESVVEKIKTNIWYSVTSFEDRALYEIMWRNMVEPEKSEMTVWGMRISRWIPKATNTPIRKV